MDKNTTSSIQIKAKVLRDNFINRHSRIKYAPAPSIPLLKYDEAFGEKGKTTLSAAGRPLTVASSVVPTADHNVWVTAYEEVLSATDTPNYAAVVRLTAGGEIDRAYGSSGYAN
ncbi:hypothetical protein [Pseudomonas sp. W2-17]|uniref:hypothetical protein n=1 Tax=Pseudomonas sp. W2-17 TaxID=3058039 RepID=UPI0034E0757D